MGRADLRDRRDGARGDRVSGSGLIVPVDRAADVAPELAAAGRLRVVVLGTTAGGGFPQWNCACPRCAGERAAPAVGRAATQASLAVALSPDEWMLVNATVDVARQVNRTRELAPGPDPRRTPLSRVLLTDSQLDHVLGLYELRQAQALEVLGPPAVLAAVRDDLGLSRTLEPYLSLTWTEVPASEPVRLGDTVTVTAIDTGAGPPRYAQRSGTRGWAVAYEIADSLGATCVYAPVVAAVSAELAAACRRAACVFFDGTFWDDDEPVRTGIGRRSAREMGHLPISGPGGSLELMASLGARHRAYIHLNNTNPLLDPESPERRRLVACGLDVARDGEGFEA